MTEITYGNVKQPPILAAIVTKAGDGAGYEKVSPRYVIGVCDHITDGDPGGSDEAQIEWYRKFFSVGGARANDALVDFVIAKGGTIGMLNDPFGARMPWASGGSDGLEGDGPAFVQARGIFGINGELVSKEHVGVSPNKMTSAQDESSAWLSAFYFDGAHNHPRGSKVPWDQYPFNPNKGIACVTAMQHFEFATKPCPGDGIRGQTDEHQARVRGLLKAAQTQAAPAPDPTPGTPTPAIKYPDGMTLATATKLFGKGALYRIGREVSHFGFKETSVVCLAWLKRGAAQGVYPEALAWYQTTKFGTDLIEVVTFANGWVLYRPSSRAAWAWM